MLLVAKTRDLFDSRSNNLSNSITSAMNTRNSTKDWLTRQETAFKNEANTIKDQLSTATSSGGIESTLKDATQPQGSLAISLLSKLNIDIKGLTNAWIMH